MQSNRKIYPWLAPFLACVSVVLSIVGYSIADDFPATSHWSLMFGDFLSAVAIILLFMRAQRKDRLAKKNAENERRFSTLVQNSGDLIAISDENRKVQFINKAGREILGIGHNRSADNFSGQMFYNEEYGKKFLDEVRPAVVKNGMWSGEFQYQNIITKEPIPVLMTIFPLTDIITGRQMGMAVVSRDIRDRKNLEKQLDRFFSDSLDMLGIANVEGYFLKLNPAFTEVLGYTEAELCSKPATEFIHPDDIQATIDQLKVQAGGKSVKSFENRYRTKNGDYRWLSWKSTPDGNLTYGVARDITEQKQQQEVMQQLSQKAIAASQAKSEFLANMSHEIRTPINGVIGMTSLLIDTELNEKQADYAQNIKNSADSLLTVINDILDFSKIEAGKLDIEKVDFNLDHVINETAKSMAWVLQHKSIPLVVNCYRGEKPLFRGDPGRIRQVLTNLLGNAIKFTTEGSVALDVHPVSSSLSTTLLRFSVKDSGIGISEDAKSKLFQSFVQADASTARKFGGTGLGLSISKKLIDLMGGQIGVESSVGKGSEFWFTITLEHSEVASPVVKPKTVIEPTKFPNAQILVAEDNFINQKILLTMLDKLGFKAQAVANGNEVLAILRQRSFDLILMDCQMPEMDGYTATGKIRETDILNAMNLPIIAMTANALTGDREKCLAAGMDDYATKPISLHDLSKLIESWLERKSA